MRRVRAYIGLGANLGSPDARIRDAIHALAELPGARLAGVSRLYATAPVGIVDQPEFRNAVAALDFPAGPEPSTGATMLLVTLKSLERTFGRQPRERWGPREIDLDLLIFGRARLVLDRPPGGMSVDVALDPNKAGKLLEVPHPEAQRRLFVLAPLADLAPRLIPPGWHETVATAKRRQALTERAEAVRPVAAWDQARGDWSDLASPAGGGR